MKPKARITVTQHRNFNKPNDYEYEVVKAKNTTTHPIGTFLKKHEVDSIIRSGVDVDIVPKK